MDWGRDTEAAMLAAAFEESWGIRVLDSGVRRGLMLVFIDESGRFAVGKVGGLYDSPHVLEGIQSLARFFFYFLKFNSLQIDR